ERLRELTPLRTERDHRATRRAAVNRVECSRDDIDPQHHAGTAAVRLVIDLSVPKRCVIAIREEPEVELSTEHGGDRPLFGQPRERMRDEREDVELHQSANPAATVMRPASRS